MFRAFLEKHQISDKKLAIAVSGGADSLALALMIASELQPLGYQIVALTVNHHLRPTASEEAAYVAQIMQQHGIQHHILSWDEKKPASGLEEAARIARYNLLKDWCLDHKIGTLMTAHHLIDQAETFLMRLQRGSGLDGLCGMAEISDWLGIKILRPLLHTHPQTMKDFLLAQKIKWIEDESNQDENLLRVRVRKFLPLLNDMGISPQQIDATMSRLQSSKNFIQEELQNILNSIFKSYDSFGFSCKYDDFISLNHEIQYRLLAEIIRKTSHLVYQPRAALILRLADKILLPDFKAATLGHCRICLSDGQLWFFPEKAEKLGSAQKEWKAFVQKNPSFKKAKIPSALRAWLVQHQ